MIVLGIDWAENLHAAHLEKDDGTALWSGTFDHSPEGFRALHAAVAEHAGDLSSVAVAIEAKHGLLVSWLIEHGFAVYPINPKSARRFCEAASTAGVKNDPLDAAMLARFLRTFRDRLEPLVQDSDLCVTLRGLVEGRQALVRQKVAAQLRLRTLLLEYYPQAINAFADLSSIIALKFLLAHETPDKAAALSLAKLRAWTRRHRYTAPHRVPALFDALRDEALRAPPAVVRAKAKLMLASARVLLSLVESIAAFEVDIKGMLDSHDDADIFRSLPGAADVLVPFLLAMYGDNRERFPTHGSVQQSAGTAPVSRSSGKSRRVTMRRSFHRGFRQALTLFARSSMRDCPWAAAYFHKRREKGDSFQLALRKLANRWAKIIWRMWQDGTRYNEAVHNSNRKCQQAPPQPTFSTV